MLGNLSALVDLSVPSENSFYSTFSQIVAAKTSRYIAAFLVAAALQRFNVGWMPSQFGFQMESWEFPVMITCFSGATQTSGFITKNTPAVNGTNGNENGDFLCSLSHFTPIFHTSDVVWNVG